MMGDIQQTMIVVYLVYSMMGDIQQTMMVVYLVFSMMGEILTMMVVTLYILSKMRGTQNMMVGRSTVASPFCPRFIIVDVSDKKNDNPQFYQCGCTSISHQECFDSHFFFFFLILST